MSNKAKGEVVFEAGGKKYTFKLGTNAQVLIENKTGMSMAKYLKPDKIEDLGAAGVRLIFWAGLTRQHPDLTEDQVGDLIDELGTDRISSLFMEAFDVAKVKEDIPAGATNGAHPQVPAKTQIGTSS